MTLSKWLCFLVLLCMAGVDARWRKIPDSLTFLLLACGVTGICTGVIPPGWAVASLLLVGGSLLILCLRLPSAIGGGDLKMCAAAAFCFGAETVLLAMSWSFVLMIVLGRLARVDRLPMAPFFAACCIGLLL